MDNTEIDVIGAQKRIAGLVRKTPVFEVEINSKAFVLKLEHLQLGGSFKYRGAANAIARLDKGVATVIASSGGNHGLAVAIAARTSGRSATIVVPESTPDDKVARIRDAGATVVVHGAEYAEAEVHARSLVDGSSAFLHPFADADVIAGQATVGSELLDQLGDRCDAVVVAVGGGGLLAGVAAALADSPIRVIGAEPSGIPTMFAALQAGHPVDVDVQSVTASSLGARRTDPLNLSIVQDWVEDVVLVDDAAIIDAQAALWNSCRLAVEPGAATALAVALSGSVQADYPCVVLCGANSGWKRV